ncbi:hypothetical protein GIB67_034156 [Kingdonia uniflora]|uniref:Germin-like protein n=1 Tax=Kingdonia uniflora TaxID=39325 RepID=A0A7J7LRV7_9MAGN|nr:hypothetical protein GIB67_034156 [Kingdonia uniflora]
MANSLALVAGLALLFLAIVRAQDAGSGNFNVPNGIDRNKIDGSYFTFTGLRNGVPAKNGVGLKTVSVTEFPALDGMGVSMELLEFPAGAVNAPHNHPRGAEMLYLAEGSLTVGTTDSNGKLYKSLLQKGDVFAFPQGLTHYQANFGTQRAVGLAAFGSSKAGTTLLPKNIFVSNIPDNVLTTSFNIPAPILQKIKAGLKN